MYKTWPSCHGSRSHKNGRFYWLLAGIGSVVVGILAGYSWSGDSASVVTIVEQQLSQSESQVRSLDRRVQAREEKLGVDSSPRRGRKPTETLVSRLNIYLQGKTRSK
jgi:hypothetical protein